MANPQIHLMRRVEDIDAETIDYLNAEGARIRKIPENERLKIGNPQPYRALGGGAYLVDNSWARDNEITLELMDATTGFVIIDNSGRVLSTFETEELGRAERAYLAAEISINVDINVPEDGPAPARRKRAAATAA